MKSTGEVIKKRSHFLSANQADFLVAISFMKCNSHNRKLVLLKSMNTPAKRTVLTLRAGERRGVTQNFETLGTTVFASYEAALF